MVYRKVIIEMKHWLKKWHWDVFLQVFFVNPYKNWRWASLRQQSMRDDTSPPKRVKGKGITGMQDSDADVFCKAHEFQTPIALDIRIIQFWNPFSPVKIEYTIFFPYWLRYLHPLNNTASIKPSITISKWHLRFKKTLYEISSFIKIQNGLGAKVFYFRESDSLANTFSVNHAFKWEIIIENCFVFTVPITYGMWTSKIRPDHFWKTAQVRLYDSL